MSDQIKKAIGEMNSSFNDFKKNHDDKFFDIEDRITGLENAGARMNLGGGGEPTNQANLAESGHFVTDVAGKQIPMLANNQKLSDYYKSGASEEEGEFSLSDYVQANILGGNSSKDISNVASGPALSPAYLAAQTIDAVRAASTVVRAGASSINIEGVTTLARITSDPTVYQHTEGAADVSESEVVLAGVELKPKALVALVPLTAEVVSDSPNLNAVLQTSLAAAFASKLDALCLATLLADATIPVSAANEATATWAGTLAAVGSAMGANQGLPPALIGNTADFIARAGQVSTDGNWLGAPDVLKEMLELPTTSMAAGTAIMGDFFKGIAIALQQNILLEVVRFSKPGSYSHVLVAHARMDGYVLQPNHLYIQKAVA